MEHLTPHIKTKAKELYLLGVTPKKICEILDIPTKILEQYIKKSWRVIKEENSNAVVTFALHSQLDATMQIIGMTNAALFEGLKRYNKNLKDNKDIIPSVRDLKALSEVISNVDKIARLERLAPTEITGKAQLTVDEARKILQEDPFALGIIPAESSDGVKFNKVKSTGEEFEKEEVIEENDK